MSDKPSRQEMEKLPLSQAAMMLIEECRMILPGIQALFGFQLIVVFNSTFAEKLSPIEPLVLVESWGILQGAQT